MIIQLQPEQISMWWDKIKYAACAAMETDSAAYVQSLLSALLSGTHQCWIIFDDERELVAMGITCIIEVDLIAKKYLHVDAFYSYQTLNDELVREATDYVKSFAVANGCGQIRTLTGNPRAARLLEVAGFYTGKTEYLLDLSG